MKKLLVTISALLLCLSIIMAQAEGSGDDVLRSKKGVPILPEVGSWAIGIDATPFFMYLGNIFTTNNNPYFPSFGFTAQAPGAIYGKYIVSETTTYRGALLIGATTETTKSQNAVDPDQKDKTTVSAVSIGLAGGIQKNRVMFGRLIGYYGAQAGIMLEPYNAGFYEGKLSFKDANDSDNNYKNVGGNTFSFSVGGLVGVEFFFAPRMALAGEFGYDLVLHTQSNREYVPSTGTSIITEYGGSGIHFEPRASGNLQLLFYF